MSGVGSAVWPGTETASPHTGSDSLLQLEHTQCDIIVYTINHRPTFLAINFAVIKKMELACTFHNVIYTNAVKVVFGLFCHHFCSHLFCIPIFHSKVIIGFGK